MMETPWFCIYVVVVFQTFGKFLMGFPECPDNRPRESKTLIPMSPKVFLIGWRRVFDSIELGAILRMTEVQQARIS